MANIVIIAPHFPTPDVYSSPGEDPRSRFLLTYAEEWVKQGHKVDVIHTVMKYPRILNYSLSILGKIIPRLTRYSQDPLTVCRTRFVYQGISINREPIFKLLPHRRIFDFVLSNYLKMIEKEYLLLLNNSDFILADYLNPSVDLTSYMKLENKKKVYPILHVTDENYLMRYTNLYKEKLEGFSKILFRNKSIQSRVLGDLNLNNLSDLIFSGIPNQVEIGQPKQRVRNIIFVGRLVESKKIHFTLKAINLLPETIKAMISFEIIGDGYNKRKLEMIVNELGLEDNVHFTPKIPHEAVFKKMNEADAFIMVTKETFGMVYVEAMSQGCLVIAAKGEGIDGVVQHGVNGFLVELDNVHELSAQIANLVNLKPDHVRNISSQAIETASNMKNSELAKLLYQSLVKINQ